MSETSILEYYNDLATSYDENRFANSYGAYIHQQEIKVLKKYLNTNEIDENIDIACGTGRFLKFAKTGVDLSPEMVKVAKQKYPEKQISVENAKSLSLENDSFKNAIAFHLFMHLNDTDLNLILKNTHRILKKEGLFIFDIPSEKRRKLTKYKAKDWHGGFQISSKTIRNITNEDWELEQFYGIGFFPIHHIPKKLRVLFRVLDSFIGKTFLKEYSSHTIYVLRKR